MGVTSDKRGLWQAHGERAIYDSPWVWLGQVDVEPPGGARYWHHVVRLRKAAVAALLDGPMPRVPLDSQAGTGEGRTMAHVLAKLRRDDLHEAE